MDLTRNRKLRVRLEDSVTRTASFSAPRVNYETAGYRDLIVTWDIASAVHSNETYDLYLVMGDGISEWDVVHFPQVATTGAKRFTARVTAERLAEITTATPGISAEPSATMKTDTAGSNEGITSIAAGKVRHGPLGDYIGWELVVAGTAPSIVYALQIQAAG